MHCCLLSNLSNERMKMSLGFLLCIIIVHELEVEHNPGTTDLKAGTIDFVLSPYESGDALVRPFVLLLLLLDQSIFYVRYSIK